MNTVEYWKNISEKLTIYLQHLGLNPVNIYLVGSTTQGYTSANSDIDCVILIEDDLPLNTLRAIRRQVYYHLSAFADPNLYHFKLFNLRELYLLGWYDGFRLLEFQMSNIPLRKTPSLIDFSPVINARTFWNSVFVQTVYEFSNSKVYGAPTDPLSFAKVKQRIARNIHLWHISGHGRNHTILPQNRRIDPSESNDPLFVRFLATANRESDKEGELSYFMRIYSNRFRHEYVNKYDTYMRLINGKKEAHSNGHIPIRLCAS